MMWLYASRAGLFAILVLLAAALAGCGASRERTRQPRLVFPTPTVIATPVASSPATPPPDLRVPVLPEVAQLLKPLQGFAAAHGDPAAANAGRIRIPRIGVDAPIDARKAPASLDLSGIYSLGPTDVTWYDFESSPRHGGTPGVGGNAVLSGHVNYNFGVRWAPGAYYSGPAVFAALDRLEPGDGIEVSFRGQTARYTVAWKREVPEHSDWPTIYARDVPEGDVLTLITCSGRYNPATQEYDARTIVRARLWRDRPAASDADRPLTSPRG